MKKIEIAFIPLTIPMIFGCNTSQHEKVQKPNFIVIYTDDLQFNGMGMYNPMVKTPEIDKIAKNSLQFTNAHVTFSISSPSRAAFLTGKYGSHNGIIDFTGGSQLNENVKTFPEYLSTLGYTCGLSGKWHIKQTPQELGFDYASYFLENGAYYNREVINDNDTVYPEIHVDEYGVNKSIEFISSCHAQNKPFFLFHCPQAPHMDGNFEWPAKEETKNLYEVENMPVPGNHSDNLQSKPEFLKKCRNFTQARVYGYPDSLAIQKHTLDYYSVITELDGFLGKLFDYLENNNFMDNTYIIFTSDNGWMLGDHGFTSKVLPYKTSTHVPFLITGPDIKKANNNSLVSNIDILPTILDLAGTYIPDDIHGLSLVPILQEKQKSVRDYFVYEGIGSMGDTKSNLTILNGNLRYIVTFVNNQLADVVFRELYNTEEDPIEMKNLVDDLKYKNNIEKLNAHLENHKQKILYMH